MVASRLLGIVGPTAAGKSELALRLARRWQGEVVSCDSLQVYRGLDIGSAKPTPAERREVPHHLVDVVAVDGSFSAAEYARLARAALGLIVGRGHLPIVVGGTGLYLRALLDGMFAGPSRDEKLRARLVALAERHGDGRLARLLSHVDPRAAARIPQRDRVRTVRALEVYYLTGRALSSQQRGRENPLRGFKVKLIGLAPSRDDLRKRVEQRTARMLEDGLVAEVERLLAQGYPSALRPLKAIGYRQAVAVIEGRLGVAQAREEVVRQTMRYAKRQMTWFRHQAAVEWCGSLAEAEATVCHWLSG
jgi:tRNA dimethylallyltransferase